MFRRTAAAAWTTSKPATRAVPPSGIVSVVRIRRVVVFPAPLGPRSPMIAPRGTAKLTPSTATVAPKRFVRFSDSIIASSLTGHPSARHLLTAW
jgi:hypothetical protein